LLDYGEPSLRTHVMSRYRQGRSTVGQCAARTSPLVKLLQKGHYDVQLDGDEWERLVTWLDLYGQQRGSFGEDQEQRLRQLRAQMAAMLAN
jgi:hypothetical protein